MSFASHHAATESNRTSDPGGPTNWSDVGIPSSATGQGTETVGTPAKLHGELKRGSPVVSSVAGAVVGVAGVTSASTSANTECIS